MTYRERQRVADIQAAIDAIRSHLQRGDLSDGLVFDAVRIRLLEIGDNDLPELERAVHALAETCRLRTSTRKIRLRDRRHPPPTRPGSGHDPTGRSAVPPPVRDDEVLSPNGPWFTPFRIRSAPRPACDSRGGTATPATPASPHRRAGERSLVVKQGAATAGSGRASKCCRASAGRWPCAAGGWRCWR